MTFTGDDVNGQQFTKRTASLPSPAALPLSEKEFKATFEEGGKGLQDLLDALLAYGPAHLDVDKSAPFSEPKEIVPQAEELTKVFVPRPALIRPFIFCFVGVMGAQTKGTFLRAYAALLKMDDPTKYVKVDETFPTAWLPVSEAAFVNYF